LLDRWESGRWYGLGSGSGRELAAMGRGEDGVWGPLDVGLPVDVCKEKD